MLRWYLVLITSVAVLTACEAPNTQAPSVPQAKSGFSEGSAHLKLSRFALNLPILKKSTYTSEYSGNKPVKLNDGVYDDLDNHVHIKMTDSYVMGDLNGDNQMEAVVDIVAETGGSGVFHNLVVYGEKDGQPVQLATYRLGDRIKMKGFAVKGSDVQVDMVTQGPNDPMCCPTLEKNVVYHLDGNQLTEVDAKP